MSFAARVEILVRRPAAELYAAFVEPAQLTRFWLAAASGRLEVGRKVRWDFLVPGASDEVEAQVLEDNRRIVIAWSDGTVEWSFAPHPEGTRMTIVHAGIADVATVVESTQGFTLVACELKALLERGESLGLVRDKAQLIGEQRA